MNVTDYSFQNVQNASLYKPRIMFIKNQLESLLRVVDLEHNGKKVNVDGFRLKNLKDWRVPSGCDPIEIFGYLGTRCNAECVFCYNKGNPPSVALGNLRRPVDEEFAEVRTRLNYFSPLSKNALFSSLGDIFEILMHPKALETLCLLRKKTTKTFRITTNGIALTPHMIASLSALSPLYLYLSLNAASVSLRKSLMRDNIAEATLKVPQMLKDAGIPYGMVIVPWPSPSIQEMLDNLSQTAACAEENDANIIQINLPGFTKRLSKNKRFDLDEVWSAVVERARALRKDLETPIVMMPSLYEENLHSDEKNRPVIIGLVKNSPAKRAGLRKEDLILSINGIPLQNRPQARDLLSLIRESRAGETTIGVMRNGKKLSITVELYPEEYPYAQDWDNHLGIVFMGTGLRLEYLEKLRDIIALHKAKKVLFLSSRLVRPVFEHMMKGSLLLADREVSINIEVPDNKFFGGNVFMGDLLVVQDYIDWIDKYLAAGRSRPDLIVIPSSPFSLGQWKRDLTGRVYLDIERAVNIPVALLECMTICD